MRKRRLATCLLILAFLTGGVAPVASAQTVPTAPDDDALWAAFTETFFPDIDEGGEGSADDALYERLALWRQNPLHLNAATRDDLLAMPFLTESVADSLMACRERWHGFTSMGDLMFVPGMGRRERQWIALLAVPGARAERPKQPLPDDTANWRRPAQRPLQTTSHTIAWTTSLPLYRRQGYTSAATEAQRYAGDATAHTLRYRAERTGGSAFGLTGQKDAGEPFARRGNSPFDYLSAYADLRPGHRGRSRLLVGDYDVYAAHGLVCGRSSFASILTIARRLPRATATLRPHTAATESGYLRGAAFTQRWQGYSVSAFASLRHIDARTEGDTIVTVYTDGMHRTAAERAHRDAAQMLTAGAMLRHETARMNWGLTVVADHFNMPVVPTPRPDNRYLLRGQDAAAFSVDYTLRRSRWSATGEVALDRRAHIATVHTLRALCAGHTALTVQLRHLSPRYVAVHADAMTQNSHTQNETGVLTALHMQPMGGMETTLAADFFVFHRPTFRATHSCAKGAQLYAQVTALLGTGTEGLWRYQMKTRQQNIAGHSDLMEYVTTHRLKAQLTLRPSARWTLVPGADATLHHSQTERAAMGWMLSLRTAWRPQPEWTASLFTSAFFTDSYDARVYAYTPQMRYAFTSAAFAYHGISGVALAEWRPLGTALHLSLRCATTRLFNRQETGSGAQRTTAPWRTDLSLQAIWRL